MCFAAVFIFVIVLFLQLMNQVDLNLKKYEIEPNWVTFYFDEVSLNTHHLVNVTHLFELYASCCCYWGMVKPR